MVGQKANEFTRQIQEVDDGNEEVVEEENTSGAYG